MAKDADGKLLIGAIILLALCAAAGQPSQEARAESSEIEGPEIDDSGWSINQPDGTIDHFDEDGELIGWSSRCDDGSVDHFNAEGESAGFTWYEDGGQSHHSLIDSSFYEFTSGQDADHWAVYRHIARMTKEDQDEEDEDDEDDEDDCYDDDDE